MHTLVATNAASKEATGTHYLHIHLIKKLMATTYPMLFYNHDALAGFGKVAIRWAFGAEILKLSMDIQQQTPQEESAAYHIWLHRIMSMGLLINGRIPTAYTSIDKGHL